MTVTNTVNASPKAKRNVKAKPAEVSAALFNPEAAMKLGKDIGSAAQSANVLAVNTWDTCRTHYCIAQGEGKATEWAEAFSKGINSVKGKKAPWARTYRSLLTRAAKLAVIITDAMPMGAVQKAVKEAQDAALGDDAKIEQALKMVSNFAASALSAGATRKAIIDAVKAALDNA